MLDVVLIDGWLIPVSYPPPGQSAPFSMDSPAPFPVCRRCRSGCWRPGSGGRWWGCLWWESIRTFRPTSPSWEPRGGGGRCPTDDSKRLNPDISRRIFRFLRWTRGTVGEKNPWTSVQTGMRGRTSAPWETQQESNSESVSQDFSRF